jgi:hypothetical protein
MNDDEIKNAELLALEAIRRVRNEKLDESLRWICDNQYYIESSATSFEKQNDGIVVIKSSAISFEEKDDGIVVTIKEGGNTFIIAYENAHSFSTPDEYVTMGDFCLNYNGADVFRTKWSERRDDEWSSSYYTLHLHSTDSVKRLMLGDWLNEINAIISKLKADKEKRESEREKGERVAEAIRILDNFNLGNTSTDDDV